MIASWMLFALLASALVSVAALATDTMLAGRHRTRFVWCGAMFASVAWPLAAMLMPRAVTENDGAAAPLAAGLLRAGAMVARASERTLHARLDTLLLGAWSVVTVLLVARIVFAFLALQRRDRTWRTRMVDGVRVRLSHDTGPAVVGLATMDVVLPEWALALDGSLRALVLTHEEEHRTARDPYLIVASAVLVALMPWNVALVWQARRLRLAIELDCDARVLSARPEHERYGMLLLAIAQRRSVHRSTLITTGISEPVSNLARRITAMRGSNSISRTRIVLLAGIGASAIAVACSMDAPVAPQGSGAAASERASVTEHRLVDTAPVYTLRTEDGKSHTARLNKAGYMQLTEKIATANVTELHPNIEKQVMMEQARDAYHAGQQGKPIVEMGVMGELTATKAPLKKESPK